METKFMQRCLHLAALGKGKVAPNPLVGCVLVKNDVIVAEGYHHAYGQAHAEVDALSKIDSQLAAQCILYVNLEPCSHQGKTPPCADLIIAKQIKHVVVAALDPNPQVSGRGVARLQAAGIRVDIGLLAQEALLLNQNFYTFHQKKRPHIYFKWAQTADGFIDRIRQLPSKASAISGPVEALLVHKWRSECQAIMVGTNTIIMDNPHLTVRHWSGSNPIRISFDRQNRLDPASNFFNQEAPSLLFVPHAHMALQNQFPHTQLLGVDFDQNFISQLLNHLYVQQIQSVMIEGGSALIQYFIDHNCWDNADVLQAQFTLGAGVRAPQIGVKASSCKPVADCNLWSYINKQTTF